MKKWFVHSYKIEELEKNLNKLTKQDYKVFKIINENYYYLVIAYKEVK